MYTRNEFIVKTIAKLSLMLILLAIIAYFSFNGDSDLNIVGGIFCMVIGMPLSVLILGHIYESTTLKRYYLYTERMKEKEIENEKIKKAIDENLQTIKSTKK